MGSRCWVVFSEGTRDGASGASIGVADHCVPTKGPTQVIVETVGAGARKSVCFFGLLGWSVVRHGSSDLDDHSFVPSGHKVISIKAHCLESRNDRLLGWRACPLPEAGSGFRRPLMPVLPL